MTFSVFFLFLCYRRRQGHNNAIDSFRISPNGEVSIRDCDICVKQTNFNLENSCLKQEVEKTVFMFVL